MAALVYSPALNGSFVFDDFHLPFSDPNAGAMTARFWIGGVRPLLMASYWANYLTSGVRPFSYHVVNLVLHATAAVLVYLIVEKVMEVSNVRTIAPWSPVIAPGVFLLHPLQTEAVDYVAGRSELLCAVFVLTGWFLFLNRFEGKTTVFRALAIILCGAAAVLSKETGVCLAGLIPATDFYFRKEGLAAQFRKRIFLYLPGLLGLGIAAIAILRGLAKSTTAGFASGATPFEYALTQCRAIAIYLRLFLFPAGQTIDWQLPFYHSLGDSYAWIYALGIVLLLAAIAGLFQRARLISFGLLVFLIALAPTSSFIPVQDALAERRMYLPIAGLGIVLVALLNLAGAEARRAATFAKILTPALLILLAVVTYNRSLAWSSDMALWGDTIAKNPRNVRALSNLGGSMMLRHDCAGAAREYKLILDMQGLDEFNGRNLGSAYECSQQPDLALALYRRLVAAHPNADVYVRIGFLEGVRNNVDAALGALEKALQLDPNNASAYAFRGVARFALHDAPDAREDFHRALALDPRNAVASAWIAKLPVDR
ncbi:MAG TPA: tetratricopeptide repeat protein [Bryobacteraceae bacterium]|nr:tetratricopeptide repeat protein [Bryobacteraceae bacterium]